VPVVAGVERHGIAGPDVGDRGEETGKRKGVVGWIRIFR
jgi:hypothetical protein